MVPAAEQPLHPGNGRPLTVALAKGALLDDSVRRFAAAGLDFSAILDPANRQSNVVVHQGKRRHYYAFPYRDYYIWGATAGMLMNFQAFLRA
jgi:hypothetical protein